MAHALPVRGLYTLDPHYCSLMLLYCKHFLFLFNCEEEKTLRDESHGAPTATPNAFS